MTATWSLGEIFVLRHAGFPFDWIEALGGGEPFMTRVDALLQMEASLLAEVESVAGKKKGAAVRAALRKGQPLPRKVVDEAGCADTAERYWGQRTALVERYMAERARLRPLMQEIAARPDIQEAVFLSSPAMFENLWSRYLEDRAEPKSDNAQTRRTERQVYTYLQRFCAKNETTSFFGPMAYGEIAPEVETLEVRPNGNTRRRTFFSFWALTELTRALNRDRGLRRDLPIRVNPLFTVEPHRVSCAPLELQAPIDEDASRLLEALRQAPSLNGAAQVLAKRVDEVERAALPFLHCAYLLVGLSMRTHDFGAFESLRQALEALPPSDAQARWRDRFAKLEALRDQFEGAGLERRRALLPQLEAFFTEYTAKAARRGEGQVYSDRMVLYEEASSPFQLKVGAAFMAELSEKVSGALELSAAYGEKVQRGYQAQLAEQLGPGPGSFDFLEYALKTRPAEVEGRRFSPVPPLMLPEEALRGRQVSSALCGEPGPGGRYALPDVCLAAVDGAQGDKRFEPMVSRVHHHLLLWSWLSAFYPDRAAYESVASSWIAKEPSARGLVGLSIRRRNKGFYVFPGQRLSYSVSDVLDLDAQALSARAVRVELRPSGPALVDAEGRALQLYLPLDDFSTYPPFAALTHPLVLHAPLRAEQAHLPRLSVDGAVYQRERWTVEREALEDLSGLEMFLEIQRQAAVGRWPRFVFVRSGHQRKPYLIDTHSPFAMDLLSHMVRDDENKAPFAFEEMYPAPEQLWLKDKRGRYTCEMRMQATRASSGLG